MGGMWLWQKLCRHKKNLSVTSRGLCFVPVSSLHSKNPLAEAAPNCHWEGFCHRGISHSCPLVSAPQDICSCLGRVQPGLLKLQELQTSLPSDPGSGTDKPCHLSPWEKNKRKKKKYSNPETGSLCLLPLPAITTLHGLLVTAQAPGPPSHVCPGHQTSQWHHVSPSSSPLVLAGARSLLFRTLSAAPPQTPAALLCSKWLGLGGMGMSDPSPPHTLRQLTRPHWQLATPSSRCLSTQYFSYPYHQTPEWLSSKPFHSYLKHLNGSSSPLDT